ncbi:MAG: hypothetical protein H0V89_14105 [Deltaproteobacteria bacterium]|nr:hypothetical protein [Deltaproteobacteria bacterium]
MQFAADPLTLAVALGLLAPHVLEVAQPVASGTANVPERPKAVQCGNVRDGRSRPRNAQE